MVMVILDHGDGLPPTAASGTLSSMPPLPLTVDGRSGWATAPRAARLAGDEIYRVFDNLDDAAAFLRRTTRDAARQRRRRDRVKRHQLVVPITIDEPILDALIALRWLDHHSAENRTAIGDAIGGLLSDLARHQ
jgi:hypothetical protein